MENCDCIIITRDINFDNTIQENLVSNDEYENTVIESLGKHHFKETLSQSQKEKKSTRYFPN